MLRTVAAVLLGALVPAVAAGQPSVQLAAGSTTSGGSLRAVSFGCSPTPKLTLLVSAEQTHVPTRVQRYEDGGYDATRGGTLRFVSGELRVEPLSVARIAPYVLVGAGGGVSRPNVNEIFTDEIRNDAVVMFGGGGVRVPLGRSLSLFGDARLLVVGEHGEAGPLLPVRVGVAWRF